MDSKSNKSYNSWCSLEEALFDNREELWFDSYDLSAELIAFDEGLFVHNKLKLYAHT